MNPIPTKNLEAGDLSRVLALLKLCLGEGEIPRTEDFWRWKHQASPFGASPGRVAVVEGQIVALRVFLRWVWQSSSGPVQAVRAVDTATHPDWRGQGLFRRLTLELVEQMTQEGVSLVFNTPNASSRPGYLKMGWQTLGRVPLLVRPLRPVRSLTRLLAHSRAKTSAPQAWRPVEELLEAPGLSQFLEGCWAGETRLHTARTHDYLSWRYQQPPDFRYGAVWSFSGKSGAIAILRNRNRRGLQEVSLSELLVGPDKTSQKTGRKLLRSLRQTGADYLVAHASSRSPERRLLLSSGFFPAFGLGPWVTLRELAGITGHSLPLDWSSWRLSIGDLELF